MFDLKIRGVLFLDGDLKPHLRFHLLKMTSNIDHEIYLNHFFFKKLLNLSEFLVILFSVITAKGNGKGISAISKSILTKTFTYAYKLCW